MNLKYCAFICLLLSLSLCQSCRQGCTNAKAYNYMPSAKQDDGSCLYCDSSLSSGFGQSLSVEDMTPGSPHEYSTVMFVTINSSYVIYNGNGCKQRGHDNTTGSSTTFYSAQVQNETNSTMTFSGTIQIEQFTLSNIVSFPVSNVIIPPNSFVNLNLGSGGVQPEFSNFSASVTSSTFTYH